MGEMKMPRTTKKDTEKVSEGNKILESENKDKALNKINLFLIRKSPRFDLAEYLLH